MTSLQQFAFLQLKWRLWERDGGTCGLCHLPVSLEETHLDHITPVSLGGRHAWDNLQPAHPDCNRKKGNGRRPTGRQATRGLLLNIHFPVNLRKRAIDVAQAEDRSFSSLVIYALRRYVTEHESEQERE